MRQIEQGKGPESDTNTLPIVLMKSKMATNNPKFYKGAIKLYKNVLPPGRCAISCKVMNDPHSRNARAPNEATYLNVIVMCQPFLSQKGFLAWKLYHNKNPNSMMPMLTFEWNILPPPHNQIYSRNYYAFSMLKLTKFPPQYGGGFTFYYTKHFLNRFIPHVYRIRPHVQAWLSWSERGTVNP